MGRPPCYAREKYPIVRMESRCRGFKGQINRRTGKKRFATAGVSNAFHLLKRRAIARRGMRQRHMEDRDENLRLMMEEGRQRRAAAAPANRRANRAPAPAPANPRTTRGAAAARRRVRRPPQYLGRG